MKTMNDEQTYLVTGATGNVGREVVAQLLADGHKVRVFTRDPAKVAHWGDRVETAVGDFLQPDSFTRALQGVTAAFLMHQSADQEAFARLVAAAKSSGTPRIVFLSSLAAEQPHLQIGRMHIEKEQAIRDSGLPWTFVRPGGFMSNSYQWIRSIAAEGVVYNPLGDTRFPPVAPEDIAAVAAKALLDPSLSGSVFDLTGGELLNVPEQVAILSKVLDRPLRSVDVPVETAVQNFIAAGIPAPIAAAVGESYQSVRNSRLVAMKDGVERVTGRKPMTFEAWARKHASRFAPPAATQPAA
jgi:(4-alkanoyl-5-oxo-2,5-dihydrofuran-3-yl)methyl phosphate reductase